MRQERPAHWIALDCDAPLGQRTLYWPGTRHIACMAQSKQGTHNSMLLECVSFDATFFLSESGRGGGRVRAHARVLQEEPSERAGIHDRERARENKSRNHRFARPLAP